MKTLLSTLAVAILFAMGSPPARGQDSVSVEFFYDNLSPHGEWFDAGDYGYVWQPNDTGDDWRPYSDGRWVYTDAGWTWDSAEPYGWAVYHYGRWAEMRDIGWVWVPGTEWGPGWVSWRRSPEYVGWAPLPPEARFSVSIGISSWADDYYDIGPGHYRFVEGRNFGAPHLNTVFVDQSRNVTIINETTNITNITYRDNVVYNGGPDYEEQLRSSSDPISRYRLDRRNDFDGNLSREGEGSFSSRVEGDSYSVAAPRLREGGGGRPANVARTVSDTGINRGWREVGNPEEVAKVRSEMKSDTPAPADLPKEPEIATRPGRVARDEAVNPTRPGSVGDPDMGEGKGKGKSGENATGMRNLPPEPGAPRPDREASGKGMVGKGGEPPAPGDRTKGREGENGAKPGDPPRPASRMPAEVPAPGETGKGEKGAAGDTPNAPRPNRMPVQVPTPGDGGKGKAERENGPANPDNGGNGRRPAAERPPVIPEQSERGTPPARSAPAPASRPEPERERTRPEARESVPRPPRGGAGNEAPGLPTAKGKDRPGGEKPTDSKAEGQKEKEKGSPGN